MEERKIQIFLNNVIAYAGNINATQPINKTSVYAKLVEQQAIDTVLPSNVIATITASSGTSAQSMIGSTQASFSSNINFFYQTAYSQLMAL